jgi:hypothetical protein
MGIEGRLNTFREDLKNLDSSIIVQKHITYGNCHILDENLYFELKFEIAHNFKIHPSQVMMVGSGKLGFSIVPDKRYRHFCDSSDIDIAIVDTNLFDIFWLSTFNYWKTNEFWPGYIDFCKYLFRGWIRPDLLPNTKSLALSQAWWDFFRQITNSRKFGPYRIRAGLYKTWNFLEEYQLLCVKYCKQEIIGDI